MRSIFVLTAVTLACGAGGFAIAQQTHGVAGTSVVSEAFGNTIVETYPDGRQARIWLKADGTYDGIGRRRDKSSGRWQVKNDQLCFHQSHPFAFGMTYCTPIPKVSMGESWQAKAFTGEEITVRVERGHVDPG